MLMMLGVAVGLVLGLTGAGGSILAVPLLMAGAALSVPQAAPVALLAVMAAAGLGAARAWRKSYVRYRAASLMEEMEQRRYIGPQVGNNPREIFVQPSDLQLP